MSYSLPNPSSPATNDPATSLPIRQNFQSLASALNAFDGGGIVSGTIPETALATAINPRQRGADKGEAYVASGMTTSGTSGSITVSSGVYYMNGYRVVSLGGSVALTLSSDNYIYGDQNGILSKVATTVGGSPTLPGGVTYWLAKITTDGSNAVTVNSQSGASPNGAVIYSKGASSPVFTNNPYKFYAYRNSALTSSASAVIFDTKITDTGNNYDTSTGRFTAPVAGFYIFTATLTLAYASAGNNIGITYLKNGSSSGMPAANIVTTFNSTFNEGQTLTTPPLQLAASDYIQVINGDSSGHNYVTGNAPAATYFSGYLLSGS